MGSDFGILKGVGSGFAWMVQVSIYGFEVWLHSPDLGLNLANFWDNMLEV